MAEFHLLYVLVQSWWGRHLCWEHLNGSSDNELSSKNTLWKVGMCQSALQLICVRAEKIHWSLAQVHGWAFLPAPGPFGVVLSCHGLLLWKPWTILNLTQMVWRRNADTTSTWSLSKCCYNILLFNKGQVNWRAKTSSSDLGLKFSLGQQLLGAGVLVLHSLQRVQLWARPLSSNWTLWGVRANSPCWSSPKSCRFQSFTPSQVFWLWDEPLSTLWTISPAPSDAGFQQTLQRLSEPLAANSWYYYWALQSHIVLHLFTGSKIWGYPV